MPDELLGGERSSRARPGAVRGRRPERGAPLPRARPASSPPTRSCGPASRRPSRTSCGRRSRACSRCWRPRSLPGAGRARRSSSRRATEVEQIRELIDDVLFLSELETGRAVVALGSTRALPVVEEVVAALGSSRGPRGRHGARARATRGVSCRCGRGCCASSSRTSPRTRSATRDPEPRSRSPSSPTAALTRCGRRGGRRRGGSPAALRAVLPGRPGPRLAGNGARPGDREAHRHRRRRHGGGGRRAGPRLDHYVCVPCSLGPFTTSTPDGHHIQTGQRPENLCGARARRRLSPAARPRARRLRTGAPVRRAARCRHDGGRRGSARRLRGGSRSAAGSPWTARAPSRR